jgi:hypothetical protein
MNVSLSLEIDGHKDIYEFFLVKAVRDTLIFAEETAIFDGKKKRI